MRQAHQFAEAVVGGSGLGAIRQNFLTQAMETVIGEGGIGPSRWPHGSKLVGGCITVIRRYIIAQRRYPILFSKQQVSPRNDHIFD
jgi:hypothetical protein